jgi:hypothetical protein
MSPDVVTFGQNLTSFWSRQETTLYSSRNSFKSVFVMDAKSGVHFANNRQLFQGSELLGVAKSSKASTWLHLAGLTLTSFPYVRRRTEMEYGSFI